MHLNISDASKPVLLSHQCKGHFSAFPLQRCLGLSKTFIYCKYLATAKYILYGDTKFQINYIWSKD